MNLLVWNVFEQLNNASWFVYIVLHVACADHQRHNLITFLFIIATFHCLFICNKIANLYKKGNININNELILIVWISVKKIQLILILNSLIIVFKLPCLFVIYLVPYLCSQWHISARLRFFVEVFVLHQNSVNLHI